MPGRYLRWPATPNVDAQECQGSGWQRFCSGPIPYFAMFLVLIPLLGLGPASAQEPAPGAPVSIVPAIPGPVEIPSEQPERVLAPIPQQFNWLGREAIDNPLLEALLGTARTPARFTVSTSLTEEVSDNFFHQPDKGPVDSRTGLALSSIYRLNEGRGFLSLANTVRAFYQARTENTQFGYANVALNAGYQLEPFSFGLTESLVRDDATGQGANTSFLNLTPGTSTTTGQDISTPLPNTTPGTTPLLRTQRRFLRNAISPQMQYALSPRTSTTIGYANTLVIDESGDQGTTVSHSATAGVSHQFGPRLSGNAQYNYTTSSGAGALGGQSQRVATSLGYGLDAETGLSLSAFGSLVERNTARARDAHSYGTSLGVRRVLFAPVSLFASAGPTVFKRQGERERLRLNWQVTLDGPIPLFNTPALTLTLTTHQNVQDTTGELADVGVVLRQTVAAALRYRPLPFFASSAFINYTRDQQLEGGTAADTTPGQTDHFWSAGLNASYALTRVISLTGLYSYQRRDSNGTSTDYDENRVTIALTGTFPVF